MVVRDLCILYGVCLLFCFVFFREEISVTNKVEGEQKGGGYVLERHLGFADAMYSLAACLCSPLRFCCLNILCEDTSR